MLVAGDSPKCEALHFENAAKVVVRHAQSLRLLLRRHLHTWQEHTAWVDHIGCSDVGFVCIISISSHQRNA